MGAVESLPLWDGGIMAIELGSNCITYHPGSIIAGLVHVYTKKNFQCTKLQVGLWATERGRFYRKKGANRLKVEMVEQFISDYTFTMEEYENEKEGPGIGYFCYPFQLRMPDWLPASTMLTTSGQSTDNCEHFEGGVSYILRAQFTPPKDDEGWASEKTNVSRFRCDQQIWIMREKPIDFIEPLLVRTIQQRVGGIFGVGADSVTTKVTFEKNIYFPGEKVKVTFFCDNTKCSKAVRAFKLKLKRKFYVQPLGKHSVPSHYSQYVVQSRSEGCPAKHEMTRVAEMMIPLEDSKDTSTISQASQRALQDPTQVMVHEALTPSNITQVITITYSIKAIIKHDCWNEFGEGIEVSVPIYIAQKWEPISIKDFKLPIPPEAGEPSYKEPCEFVERQETCKYYEEQIIPRYKKERQKCEHYHEDKAVDK